jgi:uncharacterized protein Yka (UPF0111/DUF47 family)
MDKHEKTYNDIIRFYDFAEHLVDTVHNETVTDPVTQLEFIEPLVEEVEKATDDLAEAYRTFLRTGKKPGFLAKRKIVQSIKNIYEVLGKCKRINSSKKDK